MEGVSHAGRGRGSNLLQGGLAVVEQLLAGVRDRGDRGTPQPLEFAEDDQAALVGDVPLPF